MILPWRVLAVFGLIIGMPAPHTAAAAEDDARARFEVGLGADWLSLELARRVFPGATKVEPLDGEPPAAPVQVDGQLAGYLFRTIDATRSLGFSSEPFYIAVGLGLDGRLSRVEVIEHHEPIIDLYMLQKLVQPFIDQYPGIDVRLPWRVRLTRVEEPGALDGISSATVSAVLFNEAILAAARKVARARGIRLNDEPAVDLVGFEARAFDELVADGSIGHLHVTRAALDGSGVSAPKFASLTELRDIYTVRRGDPVAADPFAAEPELVADFYVAPVMAPTIGRNLLGDMRYNLFVSGRDPRDLVLVLMTRGPYPFDEHKLQATGSLERVRLIQGETTYALSRSQYRYLNFVPGRNKPHFTQMGLYWLKADQGIDPLAPFTVEFDVVDAAEGARATFALPYRLAERYIVQPTGISIADDDGGPAWLAAWGAQSRNLTILGVMLVVLTAILAFMAPLTRYPRLYSVVRTLFLLFTLVWLGWVAGAQVTIVNVLTWLQGLIGEFSVALFMSDPLIAVLVLFVIATFVVWGRGVFCGWLCPFGALQELLSRTARLLRIPEWRPSHRAHRMLWPVKYAALAVLVALSFYSMNVAGQAAEVEPFKTAISLHFARAWPYVLYAGVLLGGGLFVERAFCRFLCPLGAAMALGGKLRWRRLEFLKRRAECGSPCQLCARKCPIQAIAPDGRINMDECFYCLDCQVVYYDAHVCPPLVAERRRRARLVEPEIEAEPAAAAS